MASVLCNKNLGLGFAPKHKRVHIYYTPHGRPLKIDYLCIFRLNGFSDLLKLP